MAPQKDRILLWLIYPTLKVMEWFNHRYRPEIPEPAPSLSSHRAKNWGYSGFPHDQNNLFVMYCGLSMKINTCD